MTSVYVPATVTTPTKLPNAAYIHASRSALRSNASLSQIAPWEAASRPDTVAGPPYSGSTTDRSPRRLQHKQPVDSLRDHMVPQRNLQSSDRALASTQPRNGTAPNLTTSHAPQSTSPRKRKSSGFKTVVRRLLGRKPMTSPSKVPAPSTHHRSDPGTFITSATNFHSQRSASAPTQELLRSSALGSHSPFPPRPSTDNNFTNNMMPAQPERPSRPRSATLPSIILNSGEGDSIATALASLSRQDFRDYSGDEGNIGFAITSSGNPKRRSRSADAFRDSLKDHRMSPIQWRRWRRRSDEIRYWTESIAEAPAALVIPKPQDRQSPQAEFIATANLEPSDTEDHAAEATHEDFNFGLLASSIQSRDQSSLEERMVTLEVKLMDLEYAISKLQDRSPSTADLHAQYLGSTKQSEASRSRTTLDKEQDPSNRSYVVTPLQPRTAMNLSPMSKPSPTLRKSQKTIHRSHEATPTRPKPRPTSIATTLRPGYLGRDTPSPSQYTKDSDTEPEATELTMEQYAKLVALFKREQSARLRLEEQVLQLQQDNKAYKAPTNTRRVRRRQPRELDTHRQYQYSHQTIEQERSSNESEETDTDDGFQEVYQTPTERQEFEHQYDTREGVAF